MGYHVPLFPKNPIFQMVVDAAILSFALTIMTQGMLLLFVYLLQEMRLF
jgi:hypothetical protein